MDSKDSNATDVANDSAASLTAVLSWAATRSSPATISTESAGQWQNLRTQIVGFNADEKLLQVVMPLGPVANKGTSTAAPVEFSPGQQVGVTFRRGHKKCVFMSRVVMRRSDKDLAGTPIETLILRAPTEVRELQRRSYQRITLSTERFIAVRLWQDGLPCEGRPAWPLCSGRVGNISLGGLLVDVRREHNPRLSVGENVGVEIIPNPGGKPFLADGQYRHCVISGEERLGLGIQFLGLERDLPGRSTMAELNAFVSGVRKFTRAD